MLAVRTALLALALALPSLAARPSFEPPSEAIEKLRALQIDTVAAAARAAAAGTPSLYETDHFSIWYTTTGTHAITGTAAAAYAGDSIPALVRVAATALEKARALYVDTLGMLAPLPAPYGSVWNQTPSGGRYPVEICEVAEAIRASGAYYGLTENMVASPTQSRLYLAADLSRFGTWSYALDSGGTRSVNYTEDWDLGMRSTAVHELFHAVQFRYEQDLSHFLFEASAVAMEERVEPEVQEYLYFVRDLFDGTADPSILTTSSSDAYPHGFYVLGLLNELGDDVIADLWADRKNDPDRDISATLADILSQHGSGLGRSFAREAARMMLSGRRAGWGRDLASALSPWSDADSAPALASTDSLTIDVPEVPLHKIQLAPGEIRILAAKGVAATDTLLALWIPQGGVGLEMVDSVTDAALDSLPRSVRLPPDGRSKPLFALSNPGLAPGGTLDDGPDSAIVWFGFASAAARTAFEPGAFAWSDGNVSLSGTASSSGLCQPHAFVDAWEPDIRYDAWAGTAAAAGARTLVLGDATGLLALDSARVTLPFSVDQAFQGGDGSWSEVGLSADGTVLEFDRLDLSRPVRLLLGAATTRIDPAYPNPAVGEVTVTFPVIGSTDGARVVVRAADGSLVRVLEPDAEGAITWDLRNGSGRRVAPGVYWYAWNKGSGHRRGRILVGD